MNSTFVYHLMYFMVESFPIQQKLNLVIVVKRRVTSSTPKQTRTQKSVDAREEMNEKTREYVVYLSKNYIASLSSCLFQDHFLKVSLKSDRKIYGIKRHILGHFWIIFRAKYGKTLILKCWVFSVFSGR